MPQKLNAWWSVGEGCVNRIVYSRIVLGVLCWRYGHVASSWYQYFLFKLYLGRRQNDGVSVLAGLMASPACGVQSATMGALLMITTVDASQDETKRVV